MDDLSVKVAVRIRPLSTQELMEDTNELVKVAAGDRQIEAGSYLFSYDYVFGVSTLQTTIYEKCVTSLMEAAFNGFNATILAYGQTGSGKTYTMGSFFNDVAHLDISLESHGIIPRAICEMFKSVKRKEASDPNVLYKISVQFLEIYGEDIRDLLDNTKTSKAVIRETLAGEVYVAGVCEQFVTSPQQMMKILQDGSKHRVTSSTLMNQCSSRSHAIFTVIMESSRDMTPLEPVTEVGSSDSQAVVIKPSVPTKEIRRSKFHFVDLAGSERLKKTGVEGLHMKEGIDINKGLLALGNVISALGEEHKVTNAKAHIPYRDSKLTRMLQDSLGGNSKTLFICCVSPASKNFQESCFALKYASRAREIKNKPVVNMDPTSLIVQELRGRISVLTAEIKLLKTDNLLCAPIVDGEFAKQQSENSTALKSQLLESDNELKRVMEQLKVQKQLVSECSERLFVMQGERDFYRMKYHSKANGESDGMIDSNSGGCDDDQLNGEKNEFVDVVSGYLRTIEELKGKLVVVENGFSIKQAEEGIIDSETLLLENELTDSVAKVIAQAQRQLHLEQKHLVANSSDLDSTQFPVIEEDIDSKNEEFLRRQSLLKSEMVELNESISLKEQLIEQLQKSQHQYALMKNFYEQKLVLLNDEVKVKESERSSLLAEIHSLEEKTEGVKEISEREAKLREMLSQKDDELRKLMKKQEDLARLTQIQQKSMGQVQKYQSDIEAQKRQRVELTKQLRVEKKKHLLDLSNKAKEIENLKKELSKRSAELKQLGLEKERAEMKAKEVGRRSIDVELNGKATKRALLSSSSFVRSVSSSSKKRLSEDFAKIRKWLDERISGIISRDADSEVLHGHVEHQMTLQQIKLSLEEEHSRICCNIDSLANEMKCCEIMNSNVAPQSEFSISENLITQVDTIRLSAEMRSEEEKAMGIQGRINGINKMIQMRKEKVDELQKKLALVDGANPSNQTMETLKRMIGSSVPAAFDLVGLLFDMLLESRVVNAKGTETSRDSHLKEQQLLQELEECRKKEKSMLRTHDLEMTKAAFDYEEKLVGLFSNNSGLASVNVNARPSNSEHDSELQGLLLIAEEKVRVLQGQVKNLEEKREQCLLDFDKFNTKISNLSSVIEEKDAHIKFLQEECRMFRDLSEDLKSEIKNVAGLTGEKIIRRLYNSNESSSESLSVSTNVGDHFSAPESSSTYEDIGLTADFSKLSEDINSAGNEFYLPLRKSVVREDTSTIGGVVYDRLTNPSNYTGAMKKIFAQDLPKKREKVQLLKTQGHASSFVVANQGNSVASTRKSYPSIAKGDDSSYFSTEISEVLPQSRGKSGTPRASSIIF